MAHDDKHDEEGATPPDPVLHEQVIHVPREQQVVAKNYEDGELANELKPIHIISVTRPRVGQVDRVGGLDEQKPDHEVGCSKQINSCEVDEHAEGKPSHHEDEVVRHSNFAISPHSKVDRKVLLFEILIFQLVEVLLEETKYEEGVDERGGDHEQIE